MKHPQVKNDFRASKEALEIRSFDQVSPPSLVSPWNVEIRWFAGSSLVSCQIANHSPLESMPIAGKNWSPRAALPFDPILIVVGPAHVAPKSSDVCSEMSEPETVRSTL